MQATAIGQFRELGARLRTVADQHNKSVGPLFFFFTADTLALTWPQHVLIASCCCCISASL